MDNRYIPSTRAPKTFLHHCLWITAEVCEANMFKSCITNDDDVEVVYITLRGRDGGGGGTVSSTISTPPINALTVIPNNVGNKKQIQRRTTTSIYPLHFLVRSVGVGLAHVKGQ